MKLAVKFELKKKPDRIFIIIFVILIFALIYNRFLRVITVEPIFKYLPKNSSVVILTSSLESLWEYSDPHIGELVRKAAKSENDDQYEDTAEQEPSPIAIFVRQLQGIDNHLKEKGIEINSPNDFNKYGLSSKKSILLSISGPIEGLFLDPEELPPISIVIPVVDAAEFEASLQKLEIITAGEKNKIKSIEINQKQYPIHLIDSNYFLVYPEPDIALISNNLGSLRAAIYTPEENLEFYRNNDAIIEGLFTSTPYHLKRGGWLKAYIKTAGLPWINNLMIVFGFQPDHLLLSVNAEVEKGQIKAFERILSSAGANKSIESRVPVESGLSFDISDRHLFYYRDILSKFGPEPVQETIKNFFHGVLDATKNLTSLKELGVFALGSRGILPDLALSLKLNRAEAEDFVFELQKRFRVARDKKIIKKALNAFQENSLNQVPVQIQDLIQAGYLSDDKQPLWHRYRINSDQITNMELRKSDFSGQSYQVQELGYRFKYILPPMTQDDFKYRFSKADLEKIDQKALLQDKYRLCSVYLADNLLIGTDADTLRSLINQKIGESNNLNLRSAYRLSGHDRFKAFIYCNPSWIIDHGLLNPDKEFQSWIKQNLMDLEQYRSLLLTLSSRERENEISVYVILKK